MTSTPAQLLLEAAVPPLGETDGQPRGGEALRDRYGSDYFRELGRKGGKALQAAHGSEHMREIGRKGGKQTRSSHDGAYYSTLARRGARARNAARLPAVEEVV